MKRIVLLQDRLMTYQDSGFSEEDQDHQVTTCLMKTPSGSIYIQPTSKRISNMNAQLINDTPPLSNESYSCFLFTQPRTFFQEIFAKIGTAQKEYKREFDPH